MVNFYKIMYIKIFEKYFISNNLNLKRMCNILILRNYFC